MRFESIIWDWNGTLLNDVDISVYSINQLLSDRNLELLTKEKYLDVFTFPVQDYYEMIGFDLNVEPFEIPAFQYITIYNDAVQQCGLHQEAIPLLRRLRQAGYRQFILSAMEQQYLEKTVKANDIHLYFEDLIGLSDNYAVSKIENGMSLINKRGLHPDTTLLIGDTIHDFEVAQAIGCNCVLIANGHQSKERLMTTGTQVLDRLDQIEFL